MAKNILILLVVALVAFAAFYYFRNRAVAPGAANGDGEPVFCTADAFQCPDGSWVGRTGPNCEFVCSSE